MLGRRPRSPDPRAARAATVSGTTRSSCPTARPVPPRKCRLRKRTRSATAARRFARWRRYCPNSSRLPRCGCAARSLAAGVGCGGATYWLPGAAAAGRNRHLVRRPRRRLRVRLHSASGGRRASRPVSRMSETRASARGRRPAERDTKQTLTAGGTSGLVFPASPADLQRPQADAVDPGLCTGTARAADIHTKISGLGAYGDTHGFLTITPQTVGPGPALGHQPAGQGRRLPRRLLDRAERTLCVDTHRVYVTGYSNGAFMTSALACKYAGRIAAAAPVGGHPQHLRLRARDGACPSSPSTAPPTTSSRTTAASGSAVASLPAPDGSGRTLGQVGSAGSKGPSIPQILAAWARPERMRQDADRARGRETTSRRSGIPAQRARTSSFIASRGGGHAWPGSPVDKPIEKVVGPVTMSINADALMWSFFTQHPLR